MHRSDIEIVKTDCTENLVSNVADIFVRYAVDKIAQKGRINVVLSGGSTPILIYQKLSSEPYRSAIAWENVWFYFGDERYVPYDSVESNYGNALRSFFAHLPVRKNQIFPMSTSFPNPQDAAHAYENTIRGVGIDFTLQGLGSDGHTASLFPGEASVEQKEKLCVAAPATKKHGPRLTLTLPVLNESLLMVVLCNGVEKRGILDKILTGLASDLPVSRLKLTHGRQIWITDS